MQPPQVDPKIAEFILDSQASDLFNFIKRHERLGKKTDFTAVITDEEKFQAVFLFKPKSQVVELDGLPQEFLDNVKTFNILGYIREGQGSVVLDLLGGLSKPFSSIKTVVDVKKILYPGSMMTFTNHLLRLRGLSRDIFEYEHDEFMAELGRMGQEAMDAMQGTDFPFTN